MRLCQTIFLLEKQPLFSRRGVWTQQQYGKGYGGKRPFSFPSLKFCKINCGTKLCVMTSLRVLWFFRRDDYTPFRRCVAHLKCDASVKYRSILNVFWSNSLNNKLHLVAVVGRAGKFPGRLEDDGRHLDLTQPRLPQTQGICRSRRK